MSASLPPGSKIAPAEIAAAGRHVFLCVGPDCCAADAGAARWEQLKREARTLGIPVLRTKAACLRVCTGGPWAVVYPEGTWYGEVTPERLTRILTEHVRDGNPIPEWTSARTGRS